MGGKRIPPNVGGRPTLYTKRTNDQVFKLAQQGCPDTLICDILCISRDTFYRWIKEKKGFSDNVKKGRAEVIAKLFGKQIDNANGFEHDASHFSAYNGEVTETKYIKKYKPSERSFELLLKTYSYLPTDAEEAAGKESITINITPVIPANNAVKEDD